MLIIKVVHWHVWSGWLQHVLFRSGKSILKVEIFIFSIQKLVFNSIQFRHKIVWANLLEEWRCDAWEPSTLILKQSTGGGCETTRIIYTIGATFEAYIIQLIFEVDEVYLKVLCFVGITQLWKEYYFSHSMSFLARLIFFLKLS